MKHCRPMYELTTVTRLADQLVKEGIITTPIDYCDFINEVGKKEREEAYKKQVEDFRSSNG